MAIKKITEELPEEQKNLVPRVLSLVLNNVLKVAYSGFDEKTKKEMDIVFSSSDEEYKNNFIKKQIPDFEKLFKEEAKKLEEELKAEIEKQI